MLVNFMNDSYIAATHAHIVTLINVVSMIRYRHDRFWKAILSSDRKAYDILNIPPTRPAKKKVKIEDVAHLYKKRKVENKV